MHNYSKELMSYLKKLYGCPERMTFQDLKEFNYWSNTLVNILKADKLYHEIVNMEKEEE